MLNPNEALNMDWAMDNAPQPRKFVLPGLRAKMFGLIVAPGGTGKTFFGLDLAASVAIGRDTAGGLFPAAPPAKVVYVAVEEDMETLHERLYDLMQVDERMNKNLRQNLVAFPWHGKDSFLLKGGETTAFFEKIKADSEGARLIIIDPLRQLHDGEENDSTSAARFVSAMSQLGKESGAAVVAIHHTNRASASDAGSQNAARGSSALVDGSRWQLNLSCMNETDAQKYDIPDAERAEYVALDFAKVNYMKAPPRHWLKRDADGRLALVELTKKNRSIAQKFGGARIL